MWLPKSWFRIMLYESNNVTINITHCLFLPGCLAGCLPSLCYLWWVHHNVRLKRSIRLNFSRHQTGCRRLRSAGVELPHQCKRHLKWCTFQTNLAWCSFSTLPILLANIGVFHWYKYLHRNWWNHGLKLQTFSTLQAITILRLYLNHH